MRIVSLLPSATEIICDLGRAESLVGRSNECTYPPTRGPALASPTVFASSATCSTRAPYPIRRCR